MGDVTIDQLERRQVDEAAAMLSRAFDDSPLFRYLFPSPRTRPPISAGTFRSLLLDALPYEHTYATRSDGRVVGIACWFAPGEYPPTRWRRMMLFARLALVMPLAPRRVPDSMRYLEAADKVHPKDEHWYLSILGIDPRRQGTGLGARLIDHTLAGLDDEGLPAYLETDKESNLAWYARRGFELVHTLHPVPAGPPTWTMWRDAS